MWESNIKNRYVRVEASRVHQGDILSDLEFFTASGDYQSDNTLLRYAVVLSQDCDLEQDFSCREKAQNSSIALKDGTDVAKHDKFVHTILICPAYPFEAFVQGQHLGEHWKMQVFPAKRAPRLKDNEDFKRYHYLEKDENLKIPELVIDFKHFYTIPRDLLYVLHQRAYIGTVNELFRESLSQRFANYLSRFGLPELGAVSTLLPTPIQTDQSRQLDAVQQGYHHTQPAES